VTPPRGWAIIGLGRAGLAKARALIGPIAREEGARLIATCSRRGPLSALAPHLDPDGQIEPLTLQEVIRDPRIDAVAICSENAQHAEQARALLSAGRHAVVDFPLCATRAEAEALFTLARARGLTLHLEQIGLLTPHHRALRARLEESLAAGDPPAHLAMSQSGGLYRWVLDEARAGRLGQLCVGRLHQAWDLVGPLTLEGASLALQGDDISAGYSLTLSLRGAQGAQVVLSESRAPDLPRQGTLTARALSGAPLEPTLRALDARPPSDGHAPRGGGAPPDLFADDLRAFYSVCRGAQPYVAREVALAVLGLAEEVSAAVGG
jgi:predicted dehydrogenase